MLPLVRGPKGAKNKQVLVRCTRRSLFQKGNHEASLTYSCDGQGRQGAPHGAGANFS